MGLVYITGIPGAGKSTVCRRLRDLGLDAHDTDQEGNAVWVDRATGTSVGAHASQDERTPDWFNRYAWRLAPGRLDDLRRWARSQLVFLCGYTSEEEAIWPHFDAVIYLDLDETTLRRRLADRTDNDFGKTAHELTSILSWRDRCVVTYEQRGAVIIDATRGLDAVVEDILVTTALSPTARSDQVPATPVLMDHRHSGPEPPAPPD